MIHGDVHLLPSGSAWIPLVVNENEELRISQGDMSAAFIYIPYPRLAPLFVLQFLSGWSSNWAVTRETIQTMLCGPSYGVEFERRNHATAVT